MTSLSQKIIKPKLGLLELAKQLGNVSQACKVMGYSKDIKNKKQESEKLKKSAKKIKSLEKELHRKEKALAEAAALLTLGKKYDALWGAKEEN